MSLAKLKLSRWAVVLAVLLMGCFLFAGVALAAPDYAGIFVPGGNPVTDQDTNVVKASHTYDYWIYSGNCFGIDVGAFADQPIEVEFPAVSAPGDQFDLTPAAGKTVPVRINTSNGEVLAQVIPEIDNVNHKATLVIQKQNLPQTGKVHYFIIEGLSVKNTCLDGNYCVKLRHPCFAGGVTSCMSLKVEPTVGEITLNMPDPPYTKGANIPVTGEVRNACGQPWPFDTWPVIIDLVDKKGLRAQDPYAKVQGAGCPSENEEKVIVNCCDNLDPCSGVSICPVIAHTKQDLSGKTVFEAEIKLPACEEYGLDYTIRARTIETQDSNQDPMIEYVDPFIVSPDLVPAEGLEDQEGVTGPGGKHIFWSAFSGKGCADTLEHAWLEALPQTITLSPGVPACIGPKECPKAIPFNKPYNFCINVYDKFGNPTTVRDAGGLKVDLAAYTGVPDNPGEVAGIFKDAAGQEITHIYIPQGATGICVTFIPNKLGPIRIEGRSIINSNRAIARCLPTVVDEKGAVLEVTPKVTNDKGDPVAGWALAAAVWLKDDQGNDINATEDYDVYVSLRSEDDNKDENWAETSVDEFCPPSCATWDTALDVTFGKAGAKKGDGDIYVGGKLACKKCYPWDKYTHPYCTVKSHFYIYPSEKCVCQVLYAQAKLVGKKTGKVILTNTVKIGPFADPVELKRVLKADTWQVLSTPQELVGSGGMKEILPASSFTDILTYKDYQWSSLAPSDKLNPLYAYYVKTKQRPTQGSPNCYVAKYVFKRVTQPGQDIPPTRTLVQGWNLAGVAMPDKMTLPPAKELDLKGNCERPLCDEPNCEGGYPCAKLYQPEFLGKMLGVTCEGCKKVYNPGGAGIGIDVKVDPTNGNTKIKLDGSPNKLANLAGFTAADVSQGTLESWALDPFYLVFNGDGYWIYTTKTQPLAAEIGQELVDP